MPRGVYARVPFDQLPLDRQETIRKNFRKGQERSGYVHSEEVRQKISESTSRSIEEKWRDPEYRSRQMLTKSLKGRDFWRDHMKHASGFQRFELTEIERLVGYVLHVLGVEYVEQYQVEYYRCDIFVPSRNLIIECDGEYWHSWPDAIERDEAKNEFLRSRGYIVVRLREVDIWDRPFELVEEVLS